MGISKIKWYKFRIKPLVVSSFLGGLNPVPIDLVAYFINQTQVKGIFTKFCVKKNIYWLKLQICGSCFDRMLFTILPLFYENGCLHKALHYSIWHVLKG